MLCGALLGKGVPENVKIMKTARGWRLQETEGDAERIAFSRYKSWSSGALPR
jgi:hypothetical protein